MYIEKIFDAFQNTYYWNVYNFDSIDSIHLQDLVIPEEINIMQINIPDNHNLKWIYNQIIIMCVCVFQTCVSSSAVRSWLS